MCPNEYIRGGAIHRTTAGSPIKTGSWRVYRPTIDQALCTSCRICFLFCPDNCILFQKDNVRVNYEYCKGCGLCAAECPKKAISMSREEEAP